MNRLLSCLSVTLCALFVSSSCMKLGPDYHRPDTGIEVPSSYQHGPPETTIGQPEDRWWEIFGDPELNQLVEGVLAEHHRQIAAMVIEPLVQAAAGMIVHPAGYLRGVRELTRRYDVLLIADEVAVGFGRTGRMFACEHERVTPDLLCLAKGLTGGYLPLAATLMAGKI